MTPNRSNIRPGHWVELFLGDHPLDPNVPGAVFCEVLQQRDRDTDHEAWCLLSMSGDVHFGIMPERCTPCDEASEAKIKANLPANFAARRLQAFREVKDSTPRRPSSLEIAERLVTEYTAAEMEFEYASTEHHALRSHPRDAEYHEATERVRDAGYRLQKAQEHILPQIDEVLRGAAHGPGALLLASEQLVTFARKHSKAPNAASTFAAREDDDRQNWGDLCDQRESYWKTPATERPDDTRFLRYASAGDWVIYSPPNRAGADLAPEYCEVLRVVMDSEGVDKWDLLSKDGILYANVAPWNCEIRSAADLAAVTEQVLSLPPNFGDIRRAVVCTLPDVAEEDVLMDLIHPDSPVRGPVRRAESITDLLVRPPTGKDHLNEAAGPSGKGDVSERIDPTTAKNAQAALRTIQLQQSTASNALAALRTLHPSTNEAGLADLQSARVPNAGLRALPEPNTIIKPMT